MRFRIESSINDRMAEAPAFEVEVEEIEELIYTLGTHDVLTNDYGVPLPVGGTLTITRLS